MRIQEHMDGVFVDAREIETRGVESERDVTAQEAMSPWTCGGMPARQERYKPDHGRRHFKAATHKRRGPTDETKVHETKVHRVHITACVHVVN